MYVCLPPIFRQQPQMGKSYKYQQLMDEKGAVQPCPHRGCTENEILAIRYGHFPVNSEKNFLPNFIYNEKVLNKPIRINSKDNIKICGNCSLSMFVNVEEAKKFWFEVLPGRLREFLKYTHLLQGNITKNMGVISKERPHFELFEYEGVELKNVFKEVGLLIKENGNVEG